MPFRSVLPAALLLPLMLALIACTSSGSPTVAGVDPTPVVQAAGHEATSTPGPIEPDNPAPPTSEVVSAPLDAHLASALRQARRHLAYGEIALALDSYRRVAADEHAPADVLLELGQAETASGDLDAARATWERLLISSPTEPLRSRGELLLASADLAQGDPASALRRLENLSAPDDLDDLLALRRAEALAAQGDPEGAVAQLDGEKPRQSTNRLLLEQAGQLAERLGALELAGELYARGARFHGWTVERSRMLWVAGSAFARAELNERAIEQYRTLVESFGWTKAAQEAGPELARLGGLTPYHRALIALAARRYDQARPALAEAVEGGDYAVAAAARLRQLEESVAWLAAGEAGTANGYRFFRGLYPNGIYAAEARFQEGLAHYQAGRTAQAFEVWSEATAEARGDEQARLHLWAGKALARLGNGERGRALWREAANVHPTGYYALRARDLLAGANGWPPGGEPAESPREEERAAAESWVFGWAGPVPSADITRGLRVRRGLGLLALGLRAEAAAEFNQLVAESTDGHFLFRLAQELAERELWVSASRAAGRLISLSPARTPAEAPMGVQRLAYPMAYPDLVETESRRRGIDPLLLLALIHQESRYDPLALSLAEARGLTQVIPPTGRGIATALGRRGFAPDDLYRPAVAVEFGAWYLSGRLATYGGDPFRALAAYNAGEGPVAWWASADPDLFVERIDYAETRSYLRQVYLHHAIYRGLNTR